jgi:hypothetical protein
MRSDQLGSGCAALCIAAILAATPAAAQEPLASLYDKYQFDLSLTTVILNADVRIDAEGVGGDGTEVDAEEDLGLPRTRLQPRGSFRWRPWHSHEFEAGYQFARRDGERLLERDISFGDSTYEAGLQVDTELNTDNLFLNYRWAAIAKERSQYGLAVGLGIIFLDVGIDAEANINESEGEVEGSKSFKAPVGSVGLYGRWLASDRWFFQADVRYIQVSISRLDAKVAEAGGSARFFIKRWIGLELGYGLSAIELDIGPRERSTGEEGIFSGRVEYSLQNARIGVVFVPNW